MQTKPKKPDEADRYTQGYRFGASGVYAAQAAHLPYSVDDYERGQRAGNVARCYGVSLA